jgi:hypothetical protein
MICLACINNAVLAVAGVASTGGLTAVSSRLLRRSGSRMTKTPETSTPRRIEHDNDANRTSHRVAS